jgi:hypothetical protein
MKREMGVYDPTKEQQMISSSRSLNLFDFTAGKKGDFYLLDDFSDASEYGGESESQIMLLTSEEGA